MIAGVVTGVLVALKKKKSTKNSVKEVLPQFTEPRIKTENVFAKTMWGVSVSLIEEESFFLVMEIVRAKLIGMEW